MTAMPATDTHAKTQLMPDEAVAALHREVQYIETETVNWQQSCGHVLAQSIRLDRPSPACDVSARDGYALRIADATKGTVPVHASIQAGQQARDIPEGAAIRIFTGAAVPTQADAVVPREQVGEEGPCIGLPGHLEIRDGQHIRRRGENGRAGDLAVEPGRVIDGPVLASLAAVGMTQVHVHRRVRVGILITGGEVLGIDEQPKPWQLRDSNGPALHGLLGILPWLEPMAPRYINDQPDAIRTAVEQLLAECDALILTGGVSVGDHDDVPSVIRDIGSKIIFHRLPIRPGKPVLGAVDRSGRPILGLPGNPVSVMVTARRLALPVLRKRAGIKPIETDYELVDAADDMQAPRSLTWFPLVRDDVAGRVALVRSMGSGDWVSAAGSAGFLEVPSGQTVTGRRRLYRWGVTT